jgi:hypothetical protein
MKPLHKGPLGTHVAKGRRPGDHDEPESSLSVGCVLECTKNLLQSNSLIGLLVNTLPHNAVSLEKWIRNGLGRSNKKVAAFGRLLSKYKI